jgi:hypothetical protein
MGMLNPNWLGLAKTVARGPNSTEPTDALYGRSFDAVPGSLDRPPSYGLKQRLNQAAQTCVRVSFASRLLHRKTPANAMVCRVSRRRWISPGISLEGCLGGTGDATRRVAAVEGSGARHQKGCPKRCGGPGMRR